MTTPAERPREWISRFHPVSSCCDPSRRMSDAVTLHALAGNAGRFALLKLIDGNEVQPGVIFDDRAGAERRKTHPAQIVMAIPPGGLRAPEAEEVLHYHRELYDQLGGRPLELPLLQPLTRADQARQIHALRKARP